MNYARRVLLGAAVALPLATAGTAGAATNAQCMLGAHVSFSDGISMQQSVGQVSSDYGNWMCMGSLGGLSGLGAQHVSVSGSYGQGSDPIVGEFGPDTCMQGMDFLSISDVPVARRAIQLLSLPAPLTLRLSVERTATLLRVTGDGAIGGEGLAVAGGGALIPDSPLSCMTTGWGSAYVSLTLHVVDAPLPSDLAPAKTASAHRHRVHHRRHSPNR
jgi:hypothetical protein